jgi:hypothetical protein
VAAADDVRGGGGGVAAVGLTLAFAWCRWNNIASFSSVSPHACKDDSTNTGEMTAATDTITDQEHLWLSNHAATHKATGMAMQGDA